jgi:hypothetical protein
VITTERNYPPIVLRPGIIGDGTEVALAASSLGLYTLNSKGVITVYLQALSTQNLAVISEPTQSFSSITAWTGSAMLYATNSSNVHVYQYNSTATAGQRWKDVSGGLPASSVAVSLDGAVFAISRRGARTKKDEIYKLLSPSALPGNVMIEPGNIKAISLSMTSAGLLVAQCQRNLL